MISRQEWRLNRDRAGKLLALVAQIPRGPFCERAWRVYRRWANAEITYEKARRMLVDPASQAPKESRE